MAIATKVAAPEPVRTAEEVLGPPPTQLRKFAVMIINTVIIAVCGALAQLFTDHAAELQQLILSFASFLPVMIQGYAGLVVGSVVTAIVAWLRARAATRTQQKIVDSLASPTPPDIQKYYKGTGNGE